MILDIVVILII